MAKAFRVDERVARLAHELWLEAMAAQGWTCGPEYDERAKKHNALVPYEQLSKQDRRHLFIAMSAEDIIGDLVRLASYHPRGPERPLTLEEMRVGLPVAAKDGPEDGPPAVVGRVESWETDRSGEFLELITVVWPDGERTSHGVDEMELRRVDEPESE